MQICENIADNVELVKTHLGQYLSDKAFTWWSKQEDVQYDTPEALYTAFIEQFDRPEPKFVVLGQLQARKYNETNTPATYADEIQKLCQKVEYGEPETIQAFVLGLPEEVRGLIASQSPTTFKAAYSALCNLQGLLPAAFKNEGKWQQTNLISDPKLSTLDTKLNQLEQKLDSLALNQIVNFRFQ